MATKKVYDRCCEFIRNQKIQSITGKSNKPALHLFGVVKLVDEAEFMRCSESEQRRHQWEDSVLLAMYAKG